MKITVAMKGVMLDSQQEEFTPHIETRVRARQTGSASGFVRGMIWGFVVSLVLWMILSVFALRYLF